ncbi:MAG: hypothetical protein AAGF01_16750 [Cyanobacteria bacterium P01_G01_bin.38]
MISPFRFPVWRYLCQPLCDNERPPVLNPQRYWQLYTVWHLEGCLNNDWPEQFWSLDYYQFQRQYQSFIERHYLEESNFIFVEHCWHLTYLRYGPYCHPEELVSDA